MKITTDNTRKDYLAMCRLVAKLYNDGLTLQEICDELERRGYKNKDTGAAYTVGSIPYCLTVHERDAVDCFREDYRKGNERTRQINIEKRKAEAQKDDASKLEKALAKIEREFGVKVAVRG